MTFGASTLRGGNWWSQAIPPNHQHNHTIIITIVVVLHGVDRRNTISIIAPIQICLYILIRPAVCDFSKKKFSTP
jgi:hypothetical protein